MERYHIRAMVECFLVDQGGTYTKQQETIINAISVTVAQKHSTGCIISKECYKFFINDFKPTEFIVEKWNSDKLIETTQYNGVKWLQPCLKSDIIALFKYENSSSTCVNSGC